MISNNLLKKDQNINNKTIKYNIQSLSLETGQFPENMKITEVLPLFKKGVKHLLNNYRPISLLIKMSKLLEKCIYTRVYNFLIKSNIIYKKQYGFRANHSCKQAIQDLCGHIY